MLKVKVIPYSLRSVGLGADPGIAYRPYLTKDIEVVGSTGKSAKTGYRFGPTASEIQPCRQIEGFGSYISERA